MTSVPTTPRYWLLQAADTKALSDTMTDAGSKRTMLLISTRGYEKKLAEHAARVERLSEQVGQGSGLSSD